MSESTGPGGRGLGSSDPHLSLDARGRHRVGWVSYEFAEALGDVTMKWHRLNGLLVLILVVWRILWGLFGSSTSRFASFVRGPKAIVGYVAALASNSPQRYLGTIP